MDKKQAVQIVHDRRVKQLSYRSLGKKYGVALSTLHRMINSKQEETPPEDESLPDDVKALKEALRKERLKNELLNTVIAERVNGILKQELLEQIYPNFKQAKEGIGNAIVIYNHLRPHSSVDMLTPEKAYIQTGEIRRRWKSYYRTTAKEVIMDG